MQLVSEVKAVLRDSLSTCRGLTLTQGVLLDNWRGGLEMSYIGMGRDSLRENLTFLPCTDLIHSWLIYLSATESGFQVSFLHSTYNFSNIWQTSSHQILTVAKTYPKPWVRCQNYVLKAPNCISGKNNKSTLEIRLKGISRAQHSPQHCIGALCSVLGLLICVCCVSLYECISLSIPRGHERVLPTCPPLSLSAYFKAESFLELETCIFSAKKQESPSHAPVSTWIWVTG